ncbi:ArsR/SmtB family transcription factor [Sciscionella marina]|uniref:ArsR/SmtB family transcription factor n=1 Tax=Sciscionella marina TaxID=508770 RepID=UPI00038003DC|nr:helix-turn-helix domain-containing protein [Sciscionella marina]
MTLRIHFTTDDLARLTIASAPDPMWELLLSLHVLQGTGEEALFRHWRSQVPRVPEVRRLFALAPPKGYSADFLTPEHDSKGLSAGLEAVLCTPPSRVRADLRLLARQRPLPAWAELLASSCRAALAELIRILAGYYRTALEPYWAQIEAEIRQDREITVRDMARDGTSGMLRTLHSALTWRAPVLELRGSHVSGDLHLNGRGLRLVPSFFCHGSPTTLADHTLSPVLVYPIVRTQTRMSAPAAGSEDGLAALTPLLGATRARVLMAVGPGCTTTELARQCAVSPASASYHAGILRAAGLLSTQRTGTAVRHTVTPLGSGLLRPRHHGAPRDQQVTPS